MREQIQSWWLPLGLALGLLYFQLTHIFPHSDIMYLLHAAKLMLAGGTYTHDFLETNPPLILCLYMPVLWLSRVSSMDLFHVFILYILCYGLLSLCLCHLLLQKFNLPNYLRNALLYALIFVTLFFPSHEFGQRDPIFLLCTLPYIFTMALRLENKTLAPILTLFIGLFAGIGIALKPFFLMLPLILEGYYLYKKRTPRAVLRPEAIAIALVLCLNVLWVMVCFPEYFRVLLPIISRLYFPGTAAPWYVFFSNIYIDYSLAGIVFFLLVLTLRLPNHYPVISTVLFLALIAYVIALTIPHAAIFYHLVPAFGASYVLFAFIFTQIGMSTYRHLIQQFSMTKTLLSVAFFIVPVFILALPVYALGYTAYIVYESEKDPRLQQLFALFNSRPTKTTYMYFSTSLDCMIFNYFANGEYVGRYPAFWWELGLSHAKKTTRIAQDEAYLINMLAENLEDAKPQIVLVDTMLPSLHIRRPSDYIVDLNKHAVFRHAWMHYHYLTTIGRLKIYERDA